LTTYTDLVFEDWLRYQIYPPALGETEVIGLAVPTNSKTVVHRNRNLMAYWVVYIESNFNSIFIIIIYPINFTNSFGLSEDIFSYAEIIEVRTPHQPCVLFHFFINEYLKFFSTLVPPFLSVLLILYYTFDFNQII
jgi:hypothetical protein